MQAYCLKCRAHRDVSNAEQVYVGKMVVPPHVGSAPSAARPCSESARRSNARFRYYEEQEGSVRYAPFLFVGNTGHLAQSAYLPGVIQPLCE